MKTLKVMMVSATLVLLSGCGLSESEKTDVALVTCSIMGESRGMDGAVRVKEINNAREKLGEDVFVEGDKSIGEAFEHGLCQELVLNDKDYSSKLANSYQEKAARILSNIDKAREDELSVIAEIQNAIHGFHTRMSFDQFEELARSLVAPQMMMGIDDRPLRVDNLFLDLFEPPVTHCEYLNRRIPGSPFVRVVALNRAEPPRH